jgi:preprotein translocase SecE subunit
VARDRKRAKQRRARRGRENVSPAPTDRSAGERSPVGGSPVRADVPGALDHASGEVDEFDAALVRGAGGVPADSETLSEVEIEIEAEAEAEGDLTEDELQEPAGPSGAGGGRAGGSGDGRGGGGGGGGGGVSPEQASGAPVRGNRAIGFLRASWAELQRVQWPDRRQVFQATAVVLGFVAIAGAYLGLADYVAKEIVESFL